jgi:hypothetical protein
MIMALEIKLLDYGDIELESSFLCSRPRLWKDPSRTGLWLSDHGGVIRLWWIPAIVTMPWKRSARRGLQFHENMIERQLARFGVKPCDVRYVLHTHLHIDHAGKDDHFPMNTTVVVNRRELECSVSGLMHPQYPKPDIQHLIERLHTRRRAAL